MACIAAMLLAGCNDFRITNELKNPYNSALSVDNGGRVSISCEESYLTSQFLEAEIEEKIDVLADASCPGHAMVTKIKLKSLTINPGEYYHKVLAKFVCTDPSEVKIDKDASHICRSIFGPSYRSLSTRTN